MKQMFVVALLAGFVTAVFMTYAMPVWILSNKIMFIEFTNGSIGWAMDISWVIRAVIFVILFTFVAGLVIGDIISRHSK
jgi:hypothetical protein